MWRLFRPLCPTPCFKQSWRYLCLAWGALHAVLAWFTVWALRSCCYGIRLARTGMPLRSTGPAPDSLTAVRSGSTVWQARSALRELCGPPHLSVHISHGSKGSRAET